MSPRKEPWVKWFPGDFLHGVSELEAEEGWVYVIVLNQIYDKEGPIPYDAGRLARRCRLRRNIVERVIKTLIEYEKLALEDGKLVNPKAEKLLEKRRERSAKAAEAAEARWREEERKSNKNKDSKDANASRNGCDQHANQKLEARSQNNKGDDQDKLDLKGEPEISPARQAFALYNEVAQRVGGVVHSKLTPGWEKSLNARMNGRGLDVWREAMEKVERSEFLCGEAKVRPGERPFRLSLEMLLRPDNFQKLLDGFYGDDRQPAAAQEGDDPRAWSRERWSRILEIYDVRGDWPDGAGPEPGQPGYLGPQTGETNGRHR